MTKSATGDQRPAVQAAGMFIRIEVDEPTASDPTAAKQLTSVCPVDIYADAGGKVEVVQANVDECILCGLCLDVGAPGSVRVVKLYDAEKLLEKG
jgi:ferredoxin-like protein FixX